MQLEYHHDDMYANKISDETMTELLNKNNFFEHGRVGHGFGEFEEVIFKLQNNR